MILRLDLTVSPDLVPATVTVKDICGRTYAERAIRERKTTVCVCVPRETLRVDLKSHGGENFEAKYLRFGNLRLAFADVQMRFDAAPQEEIEVKIKLSDATYGFPVKSAEIVLYAR